nr:protein doublesex-like [Penaeus vannamei]XP_027206789.1 protein doublesex-like [Penaeus vannamei]
MLTAMVAGPGPTYYMDGSTHTQSVDVMHQAQLVPSAGGAVVVAQQASPQQSQQQQANGGGAGSNSSNSSSPSTNNSSANDVGGGGGGGGGEGGGGGGGGQHHHTSIRRRRPWPRARRPYCPPSSMGGDAYYPGPPARVLPIALVCCPRRNR